MSAGPELAVTGASGQIGRCVLERLARAGRPALAVGRGESRLSPDSIHHWLRHDLASGWPPAQQVRRLVHAGPLTLLPDLVPEAAAAGLERLVAFSSTSVEVKAASADPAERTVVAALEQAEERVVESCRRHGVTWTLLRPTLIYGTGLDRSLTPLAALARRLGWLPLPGGGRGRRQPVHADDLAAAALAALEADAAAGRLYRLAGGSTLTYRAMLERVFRAQGLPPRLVPLPAALCRAGLAALRLLPRYRHLSTALVARINDDLVFDDSDARRDLGWNPRPFEPDADAFRRYNARL